MSKLNLPAEGQCRCGKVRLRISKPPLVTAACHCRGCQRMSASAYSLTATIPADGFEVIQGETVIGGLHGDDTRHHFCAWCMSWMFTRPVGMDWFVNVRPTMLDDPNWFEPFMETCTSARLPWASTPAVRSFEVFPEPDSYQGLMEEYAAWATRD